MLPISCKTLLRGHSATASSPRSPIRRRFCKGSRPILVRDFARRRKTEAAHLEFGDLPDDAPSREASAEEGITHREKLCRLRAAAETLPPRCREVFVMAAFEDVPLDEIARRLDISRNMVEKHMRFALQRCRAAALC